jgi:hypothetical protein
LLSARNAGYSVQTLFAEQALQYDRLPGMTDVFQSHEASRKLPDSLRLEDLSGTLTPQSRLEALADDSGVVIKQAVGKMEGDIIAAKLVELLRGQRFNGVTGEITFNQSGQNTGEAGGLRTLYNVSYDPAMSDWRSAIGVKWEALVRCREGIDSYGRIGARLMPDRVHA